MDQGKLHAKRVCNCRCSFGTSSVRADHDSIPEVWNIVLYILFEQRSTVEIIDWDIEEALILRVVEIHGNDMIRTSSCDEIGDQRACLRYPLLVARPRLEGLWLVATIRIVVTHDTVGSSRGVTPFPMREVL